MMAVNGLGEIDLDAAQLEDGPVSNRYNLLSNSGFNHQNENGALLEWYAGSQNTAEDNVRNSISLDRPALLSDYCFHFEGEAGKEKSIQQTISCICMITPPTARSPR